jgi:hypothetical protein
MWEVPRAIMGSPGAARGRQGPTQIFQHQTLKKPVVRAAAAVLRQMQLPTAHAPAPDNGVAAVVSQDHSAVLVSTVGMGVQFRRPKAASPPQKLEVLSESALNF